MRNRSTSTDNWTYRPVETKPARIPACLGHSYLWPLAAGSVTASLLPLSASYNPVKPRFAFANLSKIKRNYP